MSFPIIPTALTTAVAPAIIDLGRQVGEKLDFAHLFTHPKPSASETPIAEGTFQPIHGLRESAEQQIESIRNILETIQSRLQQLTAKSRSGKLEIRSNGFGDLRVTGPAELRATLERQLNGDDQLKQAFEDLYRYAVRAEPEILASAELTLQNADRFADVRVGNRKTELLDFSLQLDRGQLIASHD